MGACFVRSLLSLIQKGSTQNVKAMKERLRAIVLGASLLLAAGTTHAQWTNLPNPSSYHLYNIDVVSNDVIFAGGYGGSLVKSTDRGQTWQAKGYGNANWVTKIQFLDEQNGFVCTQSGNSTHGDVYATHNGGDTWTSLHSDYDYSTMFWHDANNGIVAGWDGLMLRTQDGGANWTQIAISTTANIIDVEFVDANIGFCMTTSSEFFKTYDGGTTWTKSYVSGIEAFHFRDANVGWVVTYYGKIGKTTDGGNTFTYTQSPYNFAIRDILFTDDLTGFAIGGLDCSNGNCLQSPILLTTLDGGQTWVDNQHPYVGQEEGFFEVDVAPNGQPYLSGSNRIILTDFNLATGIEAEQLVSTLNMHPNPAQNWTQIELPEKANSIQVLSISGQEVYAQNVTGLSEITLSLSDLAAGMYLVQIKNETGTIIARERLVKN